MTSATTTPTPRDFNYARKVWSWFLAPPPSDLPDVWAEKSVFFDYSKELRGPCDFTGRNYLRRPIRDSVNPSIRKQTKVMGRGNGKTLCDEVQICYKLKFVPGVRGLCVYPATKGEGGSENFVSTRLSKTIKASPGLRDVIPQGSQERFWLNKKNVKINGSHYGFIGSNSGSQGVSNRLTDIYFDEMEKYAPTLKNEAGIDKLAEGSTEGVADYQIHYGSTPTIEDGPIWKSIQKSNLHLYFVPCPHCNGGEHGATEAEREIEARAKNFQGWFIILFDEEYSAGHPTQFVSHDANLNGRNIPFAHVQFRHGPGGSKANQINDAKRMDGTWDFNRVQENAHIVCPHCKAAIRDWEQAKDANSEGHIRPEQKNWMDGKGCWICVKPGEPGHVGYMINSLYAPVLNKESSWGGRSVAFLTALEEGPDGIRTFINSILAGVFTNQQIKNNVEMTTSYTLAKSMLWVPVLSVDNQQNWPYRWFVVRNFLAQILRPRRTPEQQTEFLKQLGTEEKSLSERITGALLPPAKDENLLSPHRIMADIQRTDHWPVLGAWLVGNGLVEGKLAEFYQTEFQGDLFRMLEFIARQKEVNVNLGRQGDSEALEVGFCDTWEEIEEIQRRHQVKNGDVIIDARFGERGNHQEVYVESFMRCPPNGFYYWHPLLKKAFQGAIPGAKKVAAMGWTPCEGWQRGKRWKNKIGVALPYALEKDDPFKGMQNAGQVLIEVFRFDADWALSELARLRKRCTFTVATNCRWTPTEADQRGGVMRSAEYARHLKGYFWDDRRQQWDAPAKHGGSQARNHPNHLYDCEKNAVAYAAQKGIFRYQQQKHEEQTK